MKRVHAALLRELQPHVSVVYFLNVCMSLRSSSLQKGIERFKSDFRWSFSVSLSSAIPRSAAVLLHTPPGTRRDDSPRGE